MLTAMTGGLTTHMCRLSHSCRSQCRHCSRHSRACACGSPKRHRAVQRTSRRVSQHRPRRRSRAPRSRHRCLGTDAASPRSASATGANARRHAKRVPGQWPANPQSAAAHAPLAQIATPRPTHLEAGFPGSWAVRTRLVACAFRRGALAERAESKMRRGAKRLEKSANRRAKAAAQRGGRRRRAARH